jgi:hypothetical protein
MIQNIIKHEGKPLRRQRTKSSFPVVIHSDIFFVDLFQEFVELVAETVGDRSMWSSGCKYINSFICVLHQ